MNSTRDEFATGSRRMNSRRGARRVWSRRVGVRTAGQGAEEGRISA